jgi:hypothetical protein
VVTVKVFTLTPTVLINDKIVAAGRGLSEKDVEKDIRKVIKEKK